MQQLLFDSAGSTGCWHGSGASADQQLVQVLTRLDLRLHDVEQWARKLGVHLDVHLLERILEERETTRKQAEIR